jgi:hypothetical protein
MSFLRRRGGEPASPTDGLEFDIAVPEGLGVTRGFGGYHLTISAGEPNDLHATTISVGAVREAEGPLTLEDHIARITANAAAEAGDMSRHLVDEGPVKLAGEDAWWTFESVAAAGPAQVVERWLLVHRGVGWVVNVQMPWSSLHQVRDGAITIVSTLRFRDGEQAR